MTRSATLVDLLEQSHRGAPWHGPSRAALLADIDALAAAARPLPDAHSIWELVLHMTAWTREVARRIRCGAAREPEMGDWPSVGEPTEAAWRDARAQLDLAHEELLAAVRALPDDRLAGRLRDDRPGETAATYRDTLIGVLQHDAYHGGQVAMLRKAARARAGASAGATSS